MNRQQRRRTSRKSPKRLHAEGPLLNYLRQEGQDKVRVPIDPLQGMFQAQGARTKALQGMFQAQGTLIQHLIFTVVSLYILIVAEPEFSVAKLKSSVESKMGKDDNGNPLW